MNILKTGEHKPTGERTVPTLHQHHGILREHITRYNYILKYIVGKSVLDASCGTGYGSSLMSYLAKDITGWDISDEALEYAKTLAYYCPVKFEKVDLDKPIDGRKFDVCITFETLEHLKEPERFVAWVEKNCKTFIFSVPNPKYEADNKFHLHDFDFDKLDKFIKPYFRDIKWLGQNESINITTLKSPDLAKFFIGVYDGVRH